MNKMKLLKAVNIVLFVVFILQVLTALVMFLELSVINPRHVGLAHKYNGAFLIVLGMSHVILNWSWLVATYFKKR